MPEVAWTPALNSMDLSWPWADVHVHPSSLRAEILLGFSATFGAHTGPVWFGCGLRGASRHALQSPNLL